ncbi:MAG: RNA-binding protein [Clostridiales bacterium]|nr:MAG: RNA-binding protein [Clostridiales bacterium]
MKRDEALRLAHSEAERLLAAQAFDKAALAEKSGRVAATKFLTPAEAAFVRRFCERVGLRAAFDGGYAGAERCVALFAPEYYMEAADAVESEENPVAVLRATNSAGAALTHRDYLGALMAAGIRREAIGDIAVHGAEAYIFCLAELTPYLTQNVAQAGRARLTLNEVGRAAVPATDESDGEAVAATVSSLRVDAVAAAGFRLSREEAKAAVERGLCSVNHLPAAKPDAAVAEGDLISVRGKGRIRIAEVRGETRKGRVAVTLLRYR